MIRAVVIFVIIALIIGAVSSFWSKLDIDQKETTLKVVTNVCLVLLAAFFISGFFVAIL